MGIAKKLRENKMRNYLQVEERKDGTLLLTESKETDTPKNYNAKVDWHDWKEMEAEEILFTRIRNDAKQGIIIQTATDKLKQELVIKIECSNFILKCYKEKIVPDNSLGFKFTEELRNFIIGIVKNDNFRFRIS